MSPSLQLERMLQALQMRSLGATYIQIGQHLGVSAQRAFQLVDAGLKRTLREPADKVRSLMLEQLDGLFRVYYPRALRGDRDDAELVLALMARRAKLLGLDAPVKNVLTGADGAPLIPDALNLTREQAAIRLVQFLESARSATDPGEAHAGSVPTIQ